MPGCQRWLHFYALNELTNTILICYYITQFPFHKACLYYAVTYLIFYASLCIQLSIRRRCKSSYQQYQNIFANGKPNHPNYGPSSFRITSVTARDGFVLNIRTTFNSSSLLRASPRSSRPTTSKSSPSLPSSSSSSSKPKKVMLFAAGLGCENADALIPIMCQYGNEYTYIAWNYRGFFGSPAAASVSSCRRFLSISEHARDALDILSASGYSKFDVIVGHSMGASVAFEFALLYPDLVDRMIILNGMHGHVYSTAAQPLVRFPFAADVVSVLVESLMSRPKVMRMLRKMILPCFRLILPIYAWLWESKLLVNVLGEGYLLIFLEKYLQDVVSNDENALNWLRCLHELNAFSIYHLLPEIHQPTLIISGFFDLLTPAMQSVEIARRMKNASHYCDPFSSHCTTLESPEWCIAQVVQFLNHSKVEMKIKNENVKKNR